MVWRRGGAAQRVATGIDSSITKRITVAGAAAQCVICRTAISRHDKHTITGGPPWARR